MKKSTLLFSYFFVVFAPMGYAQVQWKDVASIFYDNCTTCHRPGEIGPFSIMGYSDVVDNAVGIQEQINSGLMPPWKADPNYVHFLDERILEQSEIDLINVWIDTFSAEAGDTLQAPNPPTFPSGSQLGTPDVVLHWAEHFDIPQGDTDHYQVFVLPTNFNQDVNVRAFEFRPGNGALVHHVFLYYDESGAAAALDALTPEYGYGAFGSTGVNAKFLTLYGPGLVPRFFPPGMGYKIPAGADMVLQVHYAPNTVPNTDSSSVNIFITPDSTIREIIAFKIGENYITEPAFGIPNDWVATFHSEYQIGDEISLMGIAPHMHLLGQSMKIFSVSPALDTIPLCFVPKWDFHWQLLYNFQWLQHLPDSSILYAEATYDNTSNNPNNPNDPPQNVFYGEGTGDEMFKYLIVGTPYEPGDENIVLDSSLVGISGPPVEGIVFTPQLYNPYPNPANDQVTVEFYLPAPDIVSLFVFDLLGRSMKRIITNELLGAGFHRRTFNVSGMTLGANICKLQTNQFRISKELMLVH